MPNGFFAQYLQKRSKAEKKEHEHQILYNQINLGSKLLLQHAILIFWNKFAIKSTIVKK